MAAPLEGIRVVDVSFALAGPLAGHYLGHFGADVVKVESPEGDYSRSAGGKGRSPGMNPFTLHTSREKRSVVLDLKSAAGQEALKRLVATADVFLHNFRPEAVSRLGLGWEAISAANPRIVYCAVMGFGSRGRYSGLPAYDDIIQCATAVPWLFQQTYGGEPLLVPSPFCDRLTGITAYAHIATALLARERDGKGRAVEVPMFETMAHLILSDHLSLRTFVPPIGPARHFRMLDPNRKPHATSDGYICLMPTHDKHWSALFALAGEPDLIRDPRYQDMRSRMAHVGELTALLRKLMATGTTAEWMEKLRAADIPAMPACTMDELIEDPHLADVGMLQSAQHPTEGGILNVQFPGDWSDWTPASRHPAPRLGENSREILAEAGYSKEAIDALIAQGVTREPAGAGGQPS